VAPYVRRILLRVHAPGSAGGCEEQQERRCAPRYGSVHFSGTTGHLTFHRILIPTWLRTLCSVSTARVQACVVKGVIATGFSRTERNNVA
jgi:hypothetical protein